MWGAIPVINLRDAVGLKPLDVDEECNLIITEYNRTVQGFIVSKVEHIVNMDWEQIMPPPSSVGRHHYLTAITKLERDNVMQLVEIIDVEKVLAEVIEYDVTISKGIVDSGIAQKFVGQKILHLDDSATARKQVDR